jgi:hypothetical protein
LNIYVALLTLANREPAGLTPDALEAWMSTLARKPRKAAKVLLIAAGIIPWIGINYYWIRIGELRHPIWMILMNFFIAFFAFVAPALDRGFRRRGPDD